MTGGYQAAQPATARCGLVSQYHRKQGPAPGLRHFTFIYKRALCGYVDAHLDE